MSELIALNPNVHRDYQRFVSVPTKGEVLTGLGVLGLLVIGGIALGNAGYEWIMANQALLQSQYQAIAGPLTTFASGAHGIASTAGNAASTFGQILQHGFPTGK